MMLLQPSDVLRHLPQSMAELLARVKTSSNPSANSSVMKATGYLVLGQESARRQGDGVVLTLHAKVRLQK